MKPNDYIAIAAICASLLTVAFNLFLDRKKRIADRRAEAYIDFLKFMMMQSNETGEKRREVGLSLLEAKQRILLYGSSSVIQGVANISIVGGGDFTSAEGAESLTNLINAMQADTSGVRSTLEDVLKTTVFPSGIPSNFKAKVRQG